MNSSSKPSSSSSSIFSHQNSRVPEDTVFYSIFPDQSLLLQEPSQNPNPYLHSLHLQIFELISPYTTDYIWQHEPFTLSISSSPIPHLHGKTRFGDNLEDEWFIVFLLFEISSKIPSVSIKVWDTDGEFLLIETAFSLPRWVNPENSVNRVFMRGGELCIVPKERFPETPALVDALKFLVGCREEARAKEEVQLALRSKIAGYPEKARLNTHRVRVRVPVSVAQVLRHEPCLISLAIEGFYDRDIDSMKHAARMEKFLGGGTGEELVRVNVRMSRAMYAQLMQQMFQAPKCYPMPPRSDTQAYVEAELGMKITCGFEMMYHQRKSAGSEVKGSTWEAFKESLHSSGYFKGLLPGSKEYRRLMETAQEYYRNSSLFSRTSEMLNAPVKRIDEILALPHSADDFRSAELPPSDDDAWLYNGEDELNTALLERQKEMDMYESKHKKGQKMGEQNGTDQSSTSGLNDFDPGDIAKTMQAFVSKISSYEGAEVPEKRDSKAVDLDVEQFIKDMESVMGQVGPKGCSKDADIEEKSSSDMDFDDSENESDADEDGDDAFMNSYSTALNKELQTTTLEKSFVRANEQPCSQDTEGTSNLTENMDEDFTPVDVDVNLVKSLLDSFSSQQGLPGPASNLLGLMGLQLPQDESKDK